MEWIGAHPWILAFVIFLARITDVSLGTVRTILVIRSHPFIAATVGFIEVLVWILAAGQVLRNLDTWYLIVAYAAGFATGNAVGVLLEARLAIGFELVRAISENRDIDLADALRGRGYTVTSMPAEGARGTPVEVVLVVEKRRRTQQLLAAIREIDPATVCTISDAKYPVTSGPLVRHWWSRVADIRNVVKKK